MTGVCECGCGLPTKPCKQSLASRGYVKGQPHRFRPGHNQRLNERQSGYRLVQAPEHPRASSHGYVLEHVVIAERALGKPLPVGAQVHHVDENTLNNANTNLVICQDVAFHKLLHIRANVVRAGGDPNTQRVCSTCRVLKPIESFWKASQRVCDGLQRRCKDCCRKHDYHRVRRGKAA